MNLLQATKNKLYTLEQINLEAEWSMQLAGMGMKLNCMLRVINKFKNKVVITIAENVQLVIDGVLANQIIIKECEKETIC